MVAANKIDHVTTSNVIDHFLSPSTSRNRVQCARKMIRPSSFISDRRPFLSRAGQENCRLSRVPDFFFSLFPSYMSTGTKHGNRLIVVEPLESTSYLVITVHFIHVNMVVVCDLSSALPAAKESKWRRPDRCSACGAVWFALMMMTLSWPRNLWAMMAVVMWAYNGRYWTRWRCLKTDEFAPLRDGLRWDNENTIFLIPQVFKFHNPNLSFLL